MATVIDSLMITLGLNASPLDKGLAQAEAKLEGGVKNLVNNVLAPLAGAFAFGALIRNYTRAADELGKFSRSIRENTQNVQGWTNAIDAAGFDSGAFQGTLKGLDDRLRNIARRGAEGSFELRALGISARDANGNVKTSTQVLDELSQVADSVNPERFRRLSEQLGLDAETIRFLQTGSKEVGILVSRYKDLAYTQKDADISRQFNVSLGDLNKTFQAFTATGLRLVVPMLTRITNGFAAFVNFIRQHEPFVMGFVTGLAALISRLLLPLIIRMAAAGWAAIAPFIPFIALVGALALLFDDLWVYINGGTSALGDFWSIFGTGEEISQALAATWEELKEVGVAVWTAVKAAAAAWFDYFGPALGSLAEVFKSTLQVIKAIFTGDFEGMIAAVSSLLINFGDFMLNIFNGIFNVILTLLSNVFGGVGQFFSNMLESLLGTFTGFIKRLIAKIPDFLLPDSIVAWAQEADKAVAEIGASMAETMAPMAAGQDANALQAIPPSAIGAIDNSSETTVNVQKIEVVAPGGDPNAIATATGSEVRKLANAGNRGVRQ